MQMFQTSQITAAQLSYAITRESTAVDNISPTAAQVWAMVPDLRASIIAAAAKAGLNWSAPTIQEIKQLKELARPLIVSSIQQLCNCDSQNLSAILGSMVDDLADVLTTGGIDACYFNNVNLQGTPS